MPFSSASLQRVSRSRSFSRSADRDLLQVLLEPLEPSLDHAEVGQDQLVFHRLRVARRVDGSCDVRHRLVAERAHDVDQRVGVLVGDHVHQRLGPPPAGGQIGELDRGRHVFPGIEHRGEPVEARVGNLGDPNLHLPSALRRPAGLADGGHELEERGLAGGRQSDESGAKHGVGRLAPVGSLLGGQTLHASTHPRTLARPL